MVKCRILYLNFETLKLLFYCHQDTKTLRLTKVKLLNLSIWCILVTWRFGGIFLPLRLSQELKYSQFIAQQIYPPLFWVLLLRQWPHDRASQLPFGLQCQVHA